MKLFNDVYRGKRVFLTGHTGFKGSWLALWLTEMGAEVTGYSLDLPTDPNHYELLDLPMTSIIGDILDASKLQAALDAAKPDIVFHMAAQPIVRESYAHPVETFATNVMGTVNVLEACRRNGQVKAIVNITSDKCYQNNEWERGYTEDDPMGGHDPYSASKGCAELVANAYRNSFFNLKEYGKSHSTLLADVRAGNVIGGGDWAKDRLIPDLVKAANGQTTVSIRNPKATRPWQHVLEPLSGYLLLGAKLLEGRNEFAENWNFGPKDEASLTVAEVISHAEMHWDKIQHQLEDNAAHPHEAHLLKLDSTKAKVRLNWSTVWESPKTFKKTIDWYKAYYEDGRITSKDDLMQYVADATAAGLEWAKGE